MRVELAYGSGRIALEAPDERVAGVWRLPAPEADGEGEGALGRALEELGVAGLAGAVRGRRVALLLADGTRTWSPRAVLPPLLPRLDGARAITAFLCTGTHDPRTPENEALAREVAELLGAAPATARCVASDARRHRFARRGRTARGTPVGLHEDADACDVFVAVADVKLHYFAGYSNPSKYVAPGLAPLETARANHFLALEPDAVAGRHPWHPDPGRRANPLAEDLAEAAEIALGGRPFLALALVTAPDGARVAWAGGGRAAEAGGRAMDAVDRIALVRVPSQRFLVLSAGGAPLDESLYTAQRALELAGAAVRDGGEVLFLARCPNGIGPPSARENFFEPLARPLAEIRAPARGDYVLYGHKPVKMARLLERLAALHVTSELPADELARAHFRPASDPQAVVDGWLASAGAGDRIAFVDDGSKLGVVPPGGITSRCRSR